MTEQKYEIIYTNGSWPEGVSIPNPMPETAEFLAEVSWSWSPMHSRRDRYYWSVDPAARVATLWIGDGEGFDGELSDFSPYAYHLHPNSDFPEVGERDMLEFALRSEKKINGSLSDAYHEISDYGIIGEQDLWDVAACIWPE